MSAPQPTAESAPRQHAFLVNPSDIWLHKWLIALVTLLFTAAGGGYVYVTPTTYEASTRVVIREDSPSLERALPGLRDREFLATQAEVIRSTLIVGEALKKAHVTLPETYEKSEIEFVLESLAVTPIIQTDVLKIAFRGEDPEQASRLVSQLVEEFEQHIRRADRGRHAEELSLLERREAELRDELKRLYAERTEFRRNSPLVGPSRETLTVQSNQLTQLAQRLSEARARRMELANKLKTYVVAKAETRKGEGIGPVVPASLVIGEFAREKLPAASEVYDESDPSTNVLRDASNASGIDFTEIQLQLWQARINFKNLANKYTPEHPEMVGAEERVQYWENLLEQRVQAAELGLYQELSAAESTESHLQNVFDQEQARVKQLDNFLVEEESLVARLARVEQSHAEALARLNEYQLTESALETGRSSVMIQPLDGPVLLVEVVWPQPKLLLGLCGLLGMVAGVVLVALRTA